MSGQIIKNYTFNPTAKTIKFNDFASIDLSSIKLITNVSNGTIIYQFNDATKLGTVSGNTLTLSYNTVSMSSSHKLMIIYEEASEKAEQHFLIRLLSEIRQAIRNPSWTLFSSKGQQVKVYITNDSESASMTLGAVSNLNGINSLDSRWLIWNQFSASYQQGIRGKIL